jgi:hypothetical protein
MRWLLYAFAALCFTATGALAQTGTPQTKTLLNTETATNFPDNNSGLITPALTRQSMVDYIASWQQAARVNAQTGTTYTVSVDDYGKLVTFSNGSPVAVTLPQATTTFGTFNSYFCNIGAGLVTITPTTSTINGAASINLATSQCLQAVSDGTNYQIFPGPPAPATTFNSPGFTNCSLAASVSANLLTVALKDAAGNDASGSSKCLIAFRNATAATGTLVIDTVQAALSINTNAVGATLGSSNSTAFRFWVVAFDNAGTVVLALYNASNATQCSPIDETQVQTSVAMSAAATAVGTYYTPNGTTLTSKAIRILGYVEYNSTGLATAGTYASAPNFINVLGSGGKTPCTAVQLLAATNSATTNTSGAVYVNTGLNKSITPTSAVNPLVVQVSGQCTSPGAGFVTIARGATQIGPQPSCGGVDSTAVMMMIDKPNTVASTNYVARVKSDGAATTSWDFSATVTVIMITEIMG